MKASDLLTTLVSFIMARCPILITGMPGVGKTEIGYQAALQCNITADNVIVSHPVLDDPTDVKGFPMRITGTDEMEFIPIGDIRRILTAEQPTLWFIDDVGQAANSMQAAYMRPLITRQIGNRHIPDCVSVIAATNRRSDKAGVSGILEPVKGRFGSIVELKADLDSWCSWAIAKGLPGSLIAFMRFRPDLLSAFNPTADMTNSPTPRTWYNLSRVEGMKLPAHIEHEVMSGSVGEGPATEYLAFRKMAAALVSIDAILAAPDKAALPKKPAECYAVCIGLAMRANDKNISRIGTYLERLTHENMGEFAALTVRDSLHRTPTLANTSEFVKMMCGPIGQLISGQSVR